MIIQFFHSKKEHKLDYSSGKNWYYSAHFRKFIKTSGKIIENYPVSLEETIKDVMIWSEWEPQSLLIKEFEEKGNDLPNFLQEPYLDFSAPFRSETKQQRQNTDPFVFGDNFHYFICRQKKALKTLNKGDIILFGSNKREGKDDDKKIWFILDTVFVISHFIDYAPQNIEYSIKPYVSEAYYKASFESCFDWALNNQMDNNEKEYRLYFGATVSNPVNGMFSFVPAVPFNPSSKRGFKRPIIELEDVISNGMNTGYKISYHKNEKEIWDEVIRQIVAQGLYLGTNFKMPIIKNSGMDAIANTNHSKNHC